ncbi:LacI family DNA-binding transcriptional regulator [Edaphobacter sp. 12200R-103]|jgi:DNA-binding LacI/PurR family transcriptional regulator|uniref:LacI family DNA-binding transcriptional regulator n=1 Tax=Edaphobacter sp. 12200R-103 TaxID=2703788 RepID=UPI00138BD2B3|nr:LacI family DNA-binding transcriptional regulator [Edaphobacter sp. 12200R-103]QHS53041.1 LacI family transcriptional regulator [Edaphobacter sp. 12200R-103]
MPPTQKELAKLAGVSAGTVSNVISGSTKVSERARQKVLEAIRLLNYQPNLIARSLKTNRTRTLGIVVPDITIPFFPKIIRGAECAAREHGYFLIVLDSEGSPDRESEMIALLRAQRIEGMLLVTASGEEMSPERWESISSAFPVVCLDRIPVNLDLDSVCVDDCGAAEMAITHLMTRGHTDIAVITGPLSLRNEQERVRGYRQALQKSGIPVQRSLVWNGSFEQDEVARLCQNGMLRPEGRPTALFATNGVTGLAALRSLYSIGLSTPRDFAFVTFDEITAEDFFQPGITSVVQPTFDMGYRAVEVLLERIEEGDTEGGRKRVHLPATLTVRESSGSPIDLAASHHPPLLPKKPRRRAVAAAR